MADQISRQVEVSVNLAAAFEKAAAAAGVAVTRTFSNAGVSKGYEARGDAQAVRRLVIKYRY